MLSDTVFYADRTFVYLGKIKIGTVFGNLPGSVYTVVCPGHASVEMITAESWDDIKNYFFDSLPQVCHASILFVRAKDGSFVN